MLKTYHSSHSQNAIIPGWLFPPYELFAHRNWAHIFSQAW